MSMRLYLVRHGQTIANAERRFQGHKDFPLSDVGRQQVERVAERLRDTPIDYIYSSDLGRAAETANVIAGKHGKHVIQKELFREYSWGAFDGLTLEEAKDTYPQIVKRNVEDWGAVDIPHKELTSDFTDRVEQTIQFLTDSHMGKRILVVSHGRFLNAFMTKVLRIREESGWAFSFVNASITIVDFVHAKKPKVRVFNDTAHLTDLEGYEDFLR